jgi:hypothetical protein
MNGDVGDGAKASSPVIASESESERVELPNESPERAPSPSSGLNAHVEMDGDERLYLSPIRFKDDPGTPALDLEDSLLAGTRAEDLDRDVDMALGSGGECETIPFLMSADLLILYLLSCHV